jgi:DNA processing protein
MHRALYQTGRIFRNVTAVYEIIQQNKTPLAIDDLSIKANMPMSLLAMTLLDMELQGFIRSLPGKMYKVN